MNSDFNSLSNSCCTFPPPIGAGLAVGCAVVGCAGADGGVGLATGCGCVGYCGCVGIGVGLVVGCAGADGGVGLATGCGCVGYCGCVGIGVGLVVGRATELDEVPLSILLTLCSNLVILSFICAISDFTC